MAKRFVSIWFRHLATDWFTHRQPPLKNLPFILRTPSHGRMIITATNLVAEQKGIHCNMVLADARAIQPDLEVQDDKPELREKLLRRIAEWCIRFSPVVAVDLPDSIFLDASGCTHLWGGDANYVNDITQKLNARGYDVRVAIADTMGAAWGIARFGKQLVVASGAHLEAIMSLPPEALRLESENLERLHKLGLHQIKQLIKIPSVSLRRRFGQPLITRLNMMMGFEMDMIEPIVPVEPYQERLPCLEPIVTATGIEIALKQLLESLCERMHQEQKGLRVGVLKCYRIDGKTERVEIGTNRPTNHVEHLFKLFEIKLPTIEPALGIELFVLEATKVEDQFSTQEKMWGETGGLEAVPLAELLDRLANRVGMHAIHRYLPDEHYWPERSLKLATSLQEKPTTFWRLEEPRPLELLHVPERIEVTAPIPDYPPMLFICRGKEHRIARADGPERIEQEWWIEQGQHRDYYRVEDEEGHRYWIFRSGHYHDENYKWFLHGFFC